MQLDKLMKYLKLIPILFLLINNNNITYSKPVPPGAGDGDVAANILFLVDSSASMQSWIGSDGLGAAPKAVYDSNDNILINQSGRRAVGIVRYTSAGKRDTATPMTFPFWFIIGPPLLPSLIVASVWKFE